MNIMSPIKTIFIALTVITFLLSCSQKEGCNFNEALNYDNMVVIDDGSCIFTSFAFYADSTHINGVLIQNIDVKIDDVLIGSFSGMEFSGNACEGANNIPYTPKSVENVSWSSEIHLFNSLIDTVIFTSGKVRTSSDLLCIEVNVLP